jgi:hypothetical protein
MGMTNMTIFQTFARASGIIEFDQLQDHQGDSSP